MKYKKLISALTAMSLVIGTVPTMVFADETSGQEDSEEVIVAEESQTEEATTEAAEETVAE
ncbi:MAG TPA: hypothetical protein DCW41_05575, partial [Clostridiales bacterium]|nr:hypothetical protein [Clostridiales bacterium]